MKAQLLDLGAVSPTFYIRTKRTVPGEPRVPGAAAQLACKTAATLGVCHLNGSLCGDPVPPWGV